MQIKLTRNKNYYVSRLFFTMSQIFVNCILKHFFRLEMQEDFCIFKQNWKYHEYHDHRRWGSQKKKKSSLSSTMLSLELTVLEFNSRDQNVLPAPLGISSPPQGDGKLGTGTSLNSQSVWAAQVCRNLWRHKLQPYILAIQGLYQARAQEQWDGLNCSVGEIIFETARRVLIKLAIRKARSNMPWGCRDGKLVGQTFRWCNQLHGLYPCWPASFGSRLL